jgi:hypothetical protein
MSDQMPAPPNWPPQSAARMTNSLALARQLLGNVASRC